ncbi:MULTISPECIES: hypothetical protein [Stenotrophomonas]|uniref:hypothetical protein n=1 Tax=Stenotrophomonas TaxID=40323 RepID=UPI001C130AFF|nr:MULTISPECIES: hypothetical protein [Stenotrophomonas]
MEKRITAKGEIVAECTLDSEKYQRHSWDWPIGCTWRHCRRLPEVEVKFLSARTALPTLLIAVLPVSAMAQLSDHHGNELQSFGLGQSSPLAANVSHDRNWLVYQFEREGISYYQVNDLAGQVHMIVARVDDVFWALPAGIAPFRISLPAKRLVIPVEAPSAVVYRSPEFMIVRYVVDGAAVWSVQRQGDPR